MSALRNRLTMRFNSRVKPRFHQPPLTLTQRRIYVLPTGAGIAYAATLLLMLVASINYNLSLGYALTFLLGSLGIVAIVHSFRNLAGLMLEPLPAAPGFAGGQMQFGVKLAAERIRPGLRLQLDGGEASVVRLAGMQTVQLAAPATRRGWQAMPRLTLETSWPLGLVRAWSHVRFDEHGLVYPAPAAVAPPLPTENGSGQRLRDDPEDFFGLRPHRATDLPQHVAWKASARLDDALLSKHFATEHGETLWLDAARAPGATLDEKLAVLTRWALDAHAAQRSFGLHLGNTEIAPATGTAHLHRCLRALALHE